MKKYLRIVLKGTPALWYDLEVSPDAVMPHIVAQMLLGQYVMAPNFFVPYESIAHMCFVEYQNGEKPLDFTKAGKLQ